MEQRDARAEPIAVVGMACRYPEADDPAGLWDVVLTRRQAFRRIPPERLDLDDYLDADRAAVDKTYSARAALLEGWEFDRAAFRIPGPVFRAADPAHWLALETVGRALADAGCPDGAGLDRQRVAVIVGNTLTGEVTRAGTLRLRWPYVRRVLAAALSESGLDQDRSVEVLDRAAARYLAPFPAVDDETLAGGLSNTIAGRICNHYDLGGGGYTVDGACSSSLLAVITACRTLRDGSADFALAGGVDISLDPFELIGFAKTGALAADRMRIYDERSAGFLPGEGCGVVALMRAADARAAGLRIHAEIVGWGISSDGSGGITRPEARGQLLALRRAYQLAGLDPTDVLLHEGHGTGTAVGDAVELSALAELRRGAPVPAALGSVKANIGHTKAAAGLAGLIKATLSVSTGILPPTTGCDSPHEVLRQPDAGLRVLSEPEAWPAGPRVAGVSAMGFGGINTHVVLRAAEPATSTALPAKARRHTPRTDVIVLSGSEPAELGRVLERLAVLAPRLSDAELHDVACHFGRQIPEGPLRVALVAATPEQLQQRAAKAAALLADLPHGRLVAGTGIYLGHGVAGRVTLLFPGQGVPVRGEDGPADTAVAQPAIHRSSVAALRWLEELGVAPRAAVGHSLGEIAGLVWAEALSIEDGDRLVHERGRLMATYGVAGTGMVSVALDAAGAHRLCEGTQLVVAAYNGRRSHVLAGPLADIHEVAERAAHSGLRATVLPVSHAFHSPAVSECGTALKDYLGTVAFQPLRRRLVSTVLGRSLSDKDCPAELLSTQVTEPVRFSDAIAEVAADTDLFCEAGPGRALSTLVTEQGGAPAVSLDTGCPGDRSPAEVAAALFAAGAVPDLSPLFAGRPARPVDIWRDRTFLANPCSSAPALTLGAPRDAAPPIPVERSPRKPKTQDPAAIVVDLIAEATELDPALITFDARLLGDLHLTSLRVVQLVGAAAEAAGRQRPAAPLSLANSSVGDLVTVIKELPSEGESTADTPAPGVASWVRCFGEEQREYRETPEALRYPGDPVYVPDPADPAAVAKLLTAGRAAIASGSLVVVTHGSGLSGFLRTLRLEHPELGITLVRVPATESGLSAASRYAFTEPGRYRELVLDAQGRATEPAAQVLQDEGTAGLPVGADDVLLVSGGGKGIGYECAAALARESGTALALLGRASPESDEVLSANLTRLRESGVRVDYQSADVTDPGAVSAAVRRLEDSLGQVTAVLHASGVNEPARFTDLDERQVHAHLAPKVTGLGNLLAAIPPEQLRLVVTFGSVIGRYGLAGESHYALANGALRSEAERLAGTLPHCRVLNLDWSVWAGAGMGERLGVLDSLLRLDVTAIPAAEGVATFLRLLGTQNTPVSVAVHGRLGALGTAELPVPAGRFLERVRAHYAGVELVADADLSLDRDPYLADHLVDGLVVLPGVVGLEAMAQAAAVLAGRPLREVRNVTLDRPVVVDPDRPRVVRVCALRRGDVIETVLRSDETGHRVDHFRAEFPLHPDADPAPKPTVRDSGTPVGPADLYGPLYFHTGRFHRVLDLTMPDARSCRATLHNRDGSPWFATGDPLLGSPGTNDATLHVLQACVPHRRLLPIGCERLTVTASTGPTLELAAAERHAADGVYVWDVVATDPDGQPVITWTGLRLKDVGPLPRTSPWPLPLLAVYLERSATALGLDPALEVSVVPEGQRSGTAAPAGISRSHLGCLTLTVRVGELLACDWEPVVERSAADWRRLLGTELEPLREQLRIPCAESDSAVSTRLWTALECLSKIGHTPGSPLVLSGVYDGGWVRLRSGTALIVSTIVSVVDVEAPVAVAILTGEGSDHA